MESLYLGFAYLIALLHGSYVFWFLWMVTLSVRGLLGNRPIYPVLFWIWVLGKIASYYILGGCILTMAEQWLRNLATGDTYSVGFIEHYTSLLGISISAPTIEGLVVTPLLVAIISELWWGYHRGSISLARLRR